MEPVLVNTQVVARLALEVYPEGLVLVNNRTTAQIPTGERAETVLLVMVSPRVKHAMIGKADQSAVSPRLSRAPANVWTPAVRHRIVLPALFV